MLVGLHGGEYLGPAGIRNVAGRRFKNRNVHCFDIEQCETAVVDSSGFEIVGSISYEWVLAECG